MEGREVLMVSVRVVLSSVLGLVLAGALSAQAWVPDLKKEDAAALDARLATLGTTYRAEPLLAAYLATGQNPQFVEVLLQKGCNPNLKAPGSALSPLALAVTRNLSPRIVALLVQAGAALEANVSGFSGTIIDIALGQQEFEAASWLVKANQRALPRGRLVLAEPYKDYAPFLSDDLVSVRNVLRYGNLSNTLIWNLALAGNSRKVQMQVDPLLNVPGSPDENGMGLGLLASNVDLLGYLLSQGLTPDQVDFDRIYTRQFANRSVEGVRALRALDPGSRPELNRPALAAGIEFLKAVTNDFADLAKPEVLQGPEGLTLLTGIYEQSDFATVEPLVRAANSEPLVMGLYRYGLGKKDPSLLRNLVAWEAPRLRPDLYGDAIFGGLDLLKALTHDFADLRNPGLYQSAQQTGREGLITLLLRSPQGGRTLLERIYEKTDFATVWGLLQPLDPPKDLLAGKTFSVAYQDWLNRGNKELLTFGFVTPGVRGIVQGDQIAVALPAATDPQALVAVFTLSGGQAMVAGIAQISGTTVNNFTKPVVYQITARDGTMKAYTVTVTVLAPPAEPPTPAPAPAP